MSRPWLAVVLVLFCLPLFVGLRSLDLETDEAIYSFAVDRILEAGEWLQPKSSPSDSVVFLEKPPLKFWIVAAPIKARLLPHDEFGLRFWDALFGAAGFLYVFAIGSMLAGSVCGFVAVLLLFVHPPLVFEHGLRTNNMEAAVFLTYCGGVYHFVRSMHGTTAARQRHAIAVAAYFALGFMTKFVAAIFLPAVLLIAMLPFRRVRQVVATDWRMWAIASAAAVALIAPWFVYAQMKFGSLLWETMLAEHVYARFTSSLNPAHVEPWDFYFRTAWEQMAPSGLRWLVPAGVLTLIVQSVRRRWFIGAVVLLWMTPLVLVSAGSSKLYHYAYPFLPPFAISAGYLVALAVMLLPVQVRRLLEAVEDAIARHVPRLSAAATWPTARRSLTAVIWVAAAIAVATVFVNPLKVSVGHTTLLKSSGTVRPIAMIVLAALFARRSAKVAVLVVALFVASFAPVDAYEQAIRRLTVSRHPMRDASECVARVQRALADTYPRGLFVDTDRPIWHPIYYYFRRIQPWVRQETANPAQLARSLHDAGELRPSLVSEVRYQEYRAGSEAAQLAATGSVPLVGLLEYLLLLPGPYAACSPEAALLNRP